MADRRESRLPTSTTEPPRRYARLRRHRRWLLALAVAALLAQMAVAMVTAAARQTPTIDEPVYVGTAVVYTREHSLRYNPEHPPLGKLIIGAGLVFAHPHLDAHATDDQTALGRRLLYESGNDPWRVMFWARLPVIVLTLLFGLVVLAFTRELVGAVGGLVALALYTLSPDVIANGSLATLDVPAAGFVLTSAWLVWRARRGRPLPHLALAGVELGAALATKMSTLPAAPVLLLRRSSPSGTRAASPARARTAGGGSWRRAWRWRPAWCCWPSPWCGPVTSSSTRDCAGPRPRTCRRARSARARPQLAARPAAVPRRDARPVRVRGRDVGGFLGRVYRGALWYYLPPRCW